MKQNAGRYFVFLLLFFLPAACGSDSGPPASDVVSSVPWRTGETLSYFVMDRKGAVVGKSTLGIDVQGATTTLTQRFTSERSRDDSSVVVDSRTLKPQSARREIVTAKDDVILEVSYTDQGAIIKQGDKQSGLSVPEHSYDNDSSLFLWRTLPFAPGYEAAYTTIITNRRNREKVRLKVSGRETVRVAAGEFQAWRLEIKTSNAGQVAWYADTPARPLVKYDNDRGTIFELERLP